MKGSQYDPALWIKMSILIDLNWSSLWSAPGCLCIVKVKVKVVAVVHITNRLCFSRRLLTVLFDQKKFHMHFLRQSDESLNSDVHLIQQHQQCNVTFRCFCEYLLVINVCEREEESEDTR